VPASGRSKRIKLPGERWIKIFDHHPAYMTLEEQEEIKSILQKNQFKRRSPVARDRVIIQGLLRCALCGASLSVHYSSRMVNSYTCRRLRDYAEKPCVSFISNDLDECILRQVFKVLRTPPIEMLKSALEASRKKKQTRLSGIQSERKQLAHEESIAREQAELARGRLPSVHFEALKTLDRVLQEKKQFEQKIALQPLAPTNDESEAELEELCRIASDVPSLWRHEAITYQERQQILRCLIDHIIVAATKERVDATIVWKSGGQTPVVVWRARSRHLIRELYAQQLTPVEIKEYLAAGKTSSGQIINIGVAGIQKSLHRMGLKPAKRSASYLSVRRKAADLDREGQSLEAIARYFNKQGFASPSGKSWSHFMVEHLLRANGEKQEPLENIHRKAITEARARGLNYQQMADEFNQKNIRRRGGLRWTAKSVAERWKDLKRMQHNREQKDLTDTKISELIALKRSA
jgi:hypothetical protein